MERLDLLYEGKTKKVFRTDDPDLLVVDYKDDKTVLNGQDADAMDEGAVSNCMTNYVFRLLEEQGIPTHYVQELSDKETVVKKAEMIPLEVIIRNVAAGSFSKKLGLEEGYQLMEPTLEFNYKNDTLGTPMVNDYFAIAIGAATREEIQRMTELAFEINKILKEMFLDKAMTLVDFKIEFGRYHGQIILADEISPDTCTLWDAQTNEELVNINTFWR